MAIDIEHLGQWVGRVKEAHDVATTPPLAGLAAALDRDEPRPEPGDAVPPGGHWLYFLDPARQSEISENGHPRTGGFLPPVPLERRMWAGGRLTFEAPLRVGDPIRRLSEIADVTAKEGKSGTLVFVKVHHQIFGPEGRAVDEIHDICYRDMPAAGAETMAPGEPAPNGAPWRRTVVPDPVLLFRYSALIFNGHRIHFDRDYVTRVEGYPGLIVHGPLIATLLMDLCRRERPDGVLRRFDYRARRPIFDLGPFAIEGRPGPDGNEAALWASDHEGAVAMTAEAAFGDG